MELSCKQKGVLEEMLNLFHNILTKKKQLNYNVHLDMCTMALQFKQEVLYMYCEYVN